MDGFVCGGLDPQISGFRDFYLTSHQIHAQILSFKNLQARISQAIVRGLIARVNMNLLFTFNLFQLQIYLYTPFYELGFLAVLCCHFNRLHNCRLSTFERVLLLLQLQQHEVPTGITNMSHFLYILILYNIIFQKQKLYKNQILTLTVLL